MEKPNKETMKRMLRLSLIITKAVADAMEQELEREVCLSELQIVIATHLAIETIKEASDEYLSAIKESCDCEGKNETRH